MDILHDETFISLLLRIAEAQYSAVVIAPPCAAYSISRHFGDALEMSGGNDELLDDRAK
jgi:hypothetical protein